MNTNQIDTILARDYYTKNNFVGAFSWNNVPNLDMYSSCIVNSDCEDFPGQHWLAYFHGDNGLEFFDSFANSPASYPGLPRKVDLINNKQVQGHDSQTCGHWCIYYLLRRYRNCSMSDIVKPFGHDFDVNDHWIGRYFFKHYNINIPVHM